MSLQDFKAAVNMFHDLVMRSRSEHTFTADQKDEHFVMEATINIQEIEPFLEEFQMTGNDQIGSFFAKGAIVCKEEGMFAWFMKDYDDKEAAGQTG